MILTTTETPIESSGMEGAKTFGMQQSKKAFKILSGLYSDIHLAIVRELGCNAADSHKSIGKETIPFHIHLPNDLEPWITIEDFGSGISHKDIYDVYATYFASTKTNTNSQIGCMGLGSKSPFAYTDTFTVQSTVNGDRRIYNAFFDEKGMPSIALMSTKKTTESNGVKIQIPVKREDFSNFCYAVKRAFRFFDTKPTISGGLVKWDDEVPTFTGDGWRSYESFGNSECFAIMGGVTYPIDINKIDQKYSAFVRHTGLVLFFDMGELDFTPSRESLEYGESTIKAINDKIGFVETNFAEEFNKNIQTKPNLLEALRAVYISERKFSFMSQASRAKAAIWNGLDISMPETFCRKLLTQAVTVYYWNSWGRSRYRTSSQFTLATDVEWYVDDLPRGTEARVKQEIKNHTDKKIMVVTQTDAQALIAAGFPDIFVKTSTLPKVAYTKGGGNGTPRTGFKIYRIGRFYQSSWESEEYDPTNVPEYFIEKKGNGFDFNLSTDKVRCNSKEHLRAICQYTGISENDIVMVGSRARSTLVADGSKPFQDVVNNLKIVIDPVVIATGQEGDGICYIDEVFNNNDFKALSDTHPFKVYANKYKAIKKSLNKYNAISGLLKSDSNTGSAKVKPLALETTDPIIHLLCKNFTSYSWKINDNLKIMVELEKREKELLTLKEKFEIL